MWVHTCLLTDPPDADLVSAIASHVFQDHTLPVAVIGDLPKVGQWLLGRARHSFDARQEVAEIDEVPSKAHLLVLRHDHDTRNIVLLLTCLLF